jgi:UPF0271 protein
MDRTVAVDLNCDLGEGFGRYDLGVDAEMMKWITSANVACGLHAGDPQVMARTVALIKDNDVALGAHPGYPDLQGFGRRSMGLSPEEIANVLYFQLGALEAFARVNGLTLVHVKPHGALYNLAARDHQTAHAIAQAVSALDPQLILVGLGGSELTRAGSALGLRVAHEGFPDRGYLPDGQLMSRDQEGALITDPEAVACNAVRLAKDGMIANGERLKVDTLCLHGDNPAAVGNAQHVRCKLEEAGVVIAPLAHIVG